MLRWRLWRYHAACSGSRWHFWHMMLMTLFQRKTTTRVRFCQDPFESSLMHVLIIFLSQCTAPHYAITPAAVNVINTFISSPNVKVKRRKVMSPEPSEAVTRTAARWRRLKENGRMTSVASQSMAAPRASWSVGYRQVQVRKINRWRDLFLQPCRPPLKKRPPVKAAPRLARRIWAILHDSGLTCGTAHRPTCEKWFWPSDLLQGFKHPFSPHGHHGDGLQTPKSSLQAFNSPYCTRKHPSLTGHLARYSDFKVFLF